MNTDIIDKEQIVTVTLLIEFNNEDNNAHIIQLIAKVSEVVEQIRH